MPFDQIAIVTLDTAPKQRHFAESVIQGRTWFDKSETINQLNRIREYSVDNLSALSRNLVESFRHNQDVNIHFAEDAKKAVSIISRIIGADQRQLAVNRSGTVTELKKSLNKAGIKTVDTYASNFPGKYFHEKSIQYTWQIPNIPFESAFSTFQAHPIKYRQPLKDYAALLGVSAISSDGYVCFMQHMQNIRVMIEEAQTLILIVGLEKIVTTKEDALFQTKCMGVFGMESVILNLNLQKSPTYFNSLDDSVQPQEVHLVIFDNGRDVLSKDSHFRNILKCIGCRACAKSCPTYQYFSEQPVNFPKKYLWDHLHNRQDLLGMCIGCGRHHKTQIL